jgi:alkanesulfonate monooxygenase SsuD/methylene tetrahydromethanopterin reductase-like flavin-dependent oxidoreductase (luciferase family)
MALDDISGGRMMCGIGAGADGFDADVFGAPRPEPKVRADRFAEFVELMDLLLRQEETSYDGAYYRAVEAGMHPGCVQRPRVPFVIAAGGLRGMRLAARHAQAWVTVGLPGRFEPGRFDRMVGPVRDQLARLDDACLAHGRDPTTLDRIVVAGVQIGGVLASRESFVEASAMYAELGCTDLVVFWPRPGAPFEGDAGVLDRIAPLLHGAAEVPR